MFLQRRNWKNVAKWITVITVKKRSREGQTWCIAIVCLPGLTCLHGATNVNGKGKQNLWLYT